MENTVFYFKNKKTTREDFIKTYGLENESPEVIQKVVDKLALRGEIRYPESKDPLTGVLEEIALDKKVEAYDHVDAFEKGIVHNKVEADLYNSVECSVLAELLDVLGIAHKIVRGEDSYVLTMHEISDKDLGKVKSRLSSLRAERKTKEILEGTSSKVIAGADFAVNKVAAPVIKAGIATGIGAIKVLAKTGVALGASLVSSTSKGIRSLDEELSRDEDVLRAKRELFGVKNAIKRTMNKDAKSTGFRIE